MDEQCVTESGADSSSELLPISKHTFVHDMVTVRLAVSLDKRSEKTLESLAHSTPSTSTPTPRVVLLEVFIVLLYSTEGYRLLVQRLDSASTQSFDSTLALRFHHLGCLFQVGACIEATMPRCLPDRIRYDLPQPH